MSDFIVGVDLGQAADYTAIAILERIKAEAEGSARKKLEFTYHLRYLDRPELGTRYPAIVAQVIGLLDWPPLTRKTPLIVDKTGVGAAVCDMFTAAGVRPHAITIHGGDQVIHDGMDYRVPKRELASTLVSLYQTRRLKVAETLSLAQTLVTELLNFKVKISIATGNDSYEAWREGIHDDLVLAVALACWYAEQHKPVPALIPQGIERVSPWAASRGDHAGGSGREPSFFESMAAEGRAMLDGDW